MSDAKQAQVQLDGGTFEVVRKRLEDQGRSLLGKVGDLDRRRRELFGSSETELLATVKVRTEHACIARDLVAVGGRLLLGCQVRMGLKSTVAPDDEFAELACAGAEIEPAKLQMIGGEPFAKDFRDIHQYYKDARLLQLRRSDTLLLAAFQTGQRLEDVRVLRWKITAAGDHESLAYIDNGGDRDYTFPPSHDFSWTRTTRDMQVQGSHPHVNILDTIFVECVGGDLTIKVENNTESGAGIFSEPVKDATQSLDDGEIHFAALEGLVLLKIRPYRENDYRHIVFNTITGEAKRIDAIGSACQQLPEGHGLIFPGGYYLASGTHKVFPHDARGMEFVRLHRAPNGEDLAYVYYERVSGVYAILRYNLIAREVDSPLICNGYCLLDDGRMIALRAEDEPARLHTLQVWRTPFASETYAAGQPTNGSFLAKLGNRELVRGISDLLHVQRLIATPQPTAPAFTDLLRHLARVRDSYHWLDHQDAGGLQDEIHGIQASANAFLGEFEMAAQLAELANQRVAGLETSAQTVIKASSYGSRDTIEAFVKPLADIRALRGTIAGAHAMARIDGAKLAAIDHRLAAAGDGLSIAALEFLGRDESLAPYRDRIAASEAAVPAMTTTAEAVSSAVGLDEIAEGLDLLVEMVNTLEVADPTRRTAILERIAETYAQLNRARAITAARRKELGGREGRAAFSAQTGLFAQAMATALALCDSPDACDEAIARLSMNLEEMEGRFADFDDHVVELATKRAEVADAFAARKQVLVDERQRRAEAIARGVDRLVQSVSKRAQAATSLEEIESLFASDQMAVKARSLLAQLRELSETVRADDGEGRLKAAREDAVRRLRDRSEIFDGDAVRLGRHRFSVNTQPLELAMVPKPGTDGPEMYFHITGTDYAARVEDEAFRSTRRFWDQPLASENAEVYRAEYLAWRILDAADHARDGLTTATLAEASLRPDGLLAIVRTLANAAHDEGYDRGVHDVDAAAILERLLHLRGACGHLRYPPLGRALGALAWSTLDVPDGGVRLRRQCRGLAGLRRTFGPAPAVA
ncbi:MAG: DNA repair ATPase, partial [Planctomycetes bacterium]|nr:DNA repair ATPase [Planctomycetota bacterium]